MKERFYRKFNGFSQEEVNKIIDTLPQRDKDIIELRYGLNGKNVTSLEELAKMFSFTNNNTLNSTIYSINLRISRLLWESARNPKSVSAVFNESRESAQKQYKKDIYTEFSDFSKEDIDFAISELSGSDRRILAYKYGLNGYSPMKNKEIALALGLNADIVGTKLSRARKKVFDILKDKESLIMFNDSDKNNIKENIKENILFEEERQEIKKYINLLENDIERIVLLLRLGFIRNRYFRLEEIANFLCIDLEEVKYIQYCAIKNISNISDESFKSIIKCIKYN